MWFRFLRENEIQDALLRLTQESHNITAQAEPEKAVIAQFHGKSCISWTPPALEIWADSATASDKILDELALFLEKQTPFQQSQLETWQNALGLGFAPYNLLKSPGIPFPAKWKQNKAWLIWEKKDNSKRASKCRLGLFVPPPRIRSLKAILGETLKDNDHFKGLLFEKDAKTGWGSPNAGFQKILRAPASEFRNNRIKILEDRFYYFEKFRDGTMLVLEQPLSFFAGISSKLNYWVIAIFLTFFGCFVYFKIEERAPRKSLNFHLSGMLGYAIGLPIICVVVLTVGTISHISSNSRQDLINSSCDLLMTVDRQFQSELSRFEGIYQKIFKNADLQGERMASFTHFIRPFFKKDLVDIVTVWNTRGQLLANLRKRSSDNSGDNNLSLIPEYLMRGNYNTKLPEPSKAKAAAFAFIDEFMEKNITNRTPGVLIPIKSEEKFDYFFWNFRDLGDRFTPFLSVKISHEQIVKSFLRRKLIQNQPFRLVALHNRSDFWYGQTEPSKEIKCLSTSITRTGEIQFGLTEINNETFFLVGMPSRQMENINLIALVPTFIWEDKIHRHWKAVFDGLVISIFVCILVGFLFYQEFIAPLGEIKLGIEALRNRNSSHEIPILIENELGKIATGLNQMLENIEEIDTANEIQWTLMRTKPCFPPGYLSALCLKMCSKIGGDFFDSFVFPNGLTGFMLGDVSGHGISACLSMAMVKAGVFLHFEDGGEAHNLMENLNGILSKVLEKRQMVACLFGWIEPEKSLVHLMNAGYISPLLWKAKEKSIKWVRSVNYPLGVRPKIKLKTIDVFLEENDLLLAFSDGLVGSPDEKQNQFGYERVENLFRKFAKESPETILELMEKEWRGHLGSQQPLDDLTLFALGHYGSSLIPPWKKCRYT